MNKELELEAEKYKNKKGSIPTTELEDSIFKQGFIDGATSKYVEKQKLEFAKKELEKFRSKLGGYDFLSGLLKQELEIQIYELEQQLSEL